MKPQDLRQGNYVLRPTNHELTKHVIDKINHVSRDIAWFVDGLITVADIHVKYLKPLPITKELLESVGFEQVFSKLFRLDCGEKAYNVELLKNPTFYYQYDAIKLKGFNHLQNIIYDLTGKELSLTEKIK